MVGARRDLRSLCRIFQNYIRIFRSDPCHQKKVLALVLAFACAFTMFAGAAYSDQADIQHTDAVNMLSSLGVLDGYEDGSFRPEATITRAEMAKMIYTIRNGGNDNADAYKSLSTSFTDVNGTWAEGYIKYCQVNGIIDGKSTTSFDPNGNVTVVETAKMALVLMGYKADADRANLVGTGWDQRTLALAGDNGLMDNVSGGVASPIIRDEAAQLLYNSIDAQCVIWSNDHESFIQDTTTVGSGKDSYVKVYTVGSKYMGLQQWIGSFDGNSDVCKLDDGMIQVTGSLDGNLKNNTDGKAIKATFVYDFDLSYIGEEVSVLFKDERGGTDDQPDKKDTIYGVYTTGATKVYNITKNDLQDQKEAGTVRFGDKNYDVAASTDDFVYIDKNYGADTTAKGAKTADEVADAITALKAVSADTIKLVCNDNGDITKAFVVESKLARVTAVNSDKVSLNNGIGTIKLEDNDVYSGIAKDDIVVVTTFYNTSATNSAAYNTVTKAETISGKLDGYNGVKKATLDGTTYSMYLENIATNKGLDTDFVDKFDDQIGESYTFYMVGGIVYAAEQTSDGAKNYAVVEANNNGVLDAAFSPLEVKIMKADGTEGTYVLHKDSTTDGSTPVDKNNLTIGTIIKYSDVSDGKIKVTEAAAPIESTIAEAGTAATDVVYDKDTKSFATAANGATKVVTTSDAVVFVNKSGDFYAYTVRNLDTISVTGKTTGNGDVKYSTASMQDDNKVVAAYVTLANKPSGASSDTVYGIVSAENGTIKNGNDTYTSWTVQVDDNRDNDKTVLVEGAGLTTIAKGDLVSFDVAADNVYAVGDLTVYKTAAGTTAQNGAVAAYADEYDEAGQILTYFTGVTGGDPYTGTGSTVKAVDDDVQIIYVDAEDNVGASAVGVNEFDAVTGKKNIVVVFDENNENKPIVAIYVDVDNNIEQ